MSKQFRNESHKSIIIIIPSLTCSFPCTSNTYPCVTAKMNTFTMYMKCHNSSKQLYRNRQTVQCTCVHVQSFTSQGCATGAMAIHVAPHLPLKRQGTYFQRQCHRWTVRNDCLISQLYSTSRTWTISYNTCVRKIIRYNYIFYSHILEPPYGSHSSRVYTCII